MQASRREKTTHARAVAQGAGAAPRSLTSAELAEVDAALRPWAEAEAARLLRRGELGVRERAEVVGEVRMELDVDAPAESAVERARREDAAQGRLPWGAPARGRWSPPPPRVRAAERVTLLRETVRWGLAWNKWHEARAASLRRGLSARLASCGQRELGCACRRCGKVHVVRSRCGDRYCGGCSAAYYGRLRHRLTSAAHAWMRALWSRERHVRTRIGECSHCGKQHPAHGSGRSRPQLWTLTVEHGETAAETRARITRAWVRLRAWLHWQLGRAVPYALVWEWTKGTGEHGAHVHAHVLVLAPPLCWSRLSAEWVRATDGRGRGVGHPRSRARGGDGSTAATAAARYMAKYASKGSAVHAGEDVDAALLAEVWASGYAKRRVTASRGFWVRRTNVSACCRAPWAVLGSWGASMDNGEGVPNVRPRWALPLPSEEPHPRWRYVPP